MADAPKSLKDIADAAALARPTYFDDPAMDGLLALLLELAEKNCVLRDRLKSAEALHEGLGEEIDAFEPSSEETAARLEAHSDHFNALMQRVADLINR